MVKFLCKYPPEHPNFDKILGKKSFSGKKSHFFIKKLEKKPFNLIYMEKKYLFRKLSLDLPDTYQVLTLLNNLL